MQENSAENFAQAYPAITAALQELPVGATRKEKTKVVAKMLFLDFGIHPSAKVVLDFTRQGSMTDISRDLKEFWEELRKRIRLEIQIPVLPEELQVVFSEALGKLWALSTERAQQSLEALRLECQMQVDESKLEARAAQSERTEAWAHVEKLNEQITALNERLIAAERRSDAQVAEIGGLEATLESCQLQAEAEADARRESEERFLGELEKERMERRVEADRFFGEINFAKRQIEAARAAEKDVRGMLQAEKSSKDLEVSSYRQRMNKAEEAMIALSSEYAQVNSQKNWLEGKVLELQDRIKELAKAGTSSSKRAPRFTQLKRKTLR